VPTLSRPSHSPTHTQREPAFSLAAATLCPLDESPVPDSQTIHPWDFPIRLAIIAGDRDRLWPRCRLEPLTVRELQVLVALGEPGMTRKEVAERLGISVATVRTHLRAIYLKLGINVTRNSGHHALQAERTLAARLGIETATELCLRAASAQPSRRARAGEHRPGDTAAADQSQPTPSWAESKPRSWRVDQVAAGRNAW
jgi:hypothetical protein